MSQGLQPEHKGQEQVSAATMSSLRFLRHRLEQSITQVAGQQAFLQRAAQLLTSAIGQDCIAWAAFQGEQVQITGLNMPIEGLAETVQQAIASRSIESLRAGLTHVSQLNETQQFNCICAPVRNSPNPGALVVLHSSEKHKLPFVLSAVELVASSIASADFRSETTAANAEASQASALVDLLTRVESTSSLGTGCRALCEELQKFFGCHQVYLGLIDETDEVVRYETQSGNSPPSDEFELVVSAAMHESLMHAQPVAYPKLHDGPQHSLLAHRLLVQEVDSTHIVSAPLQTEDGIPRGAVILEGAESELGSQQTLRFLEAAGPRIAGSLALLQRAERRGLERAAMSARAIVKDHKSRAIGAAVLGGMLLLCLPLPYKVKTNCELQPLNHRYVAAPFEAPLDQCLVEPGDVVEPDALLARLDGREIRMSLSEVASDLNRSARESQMHRAKGEYGPAEMARLQKESHQARKELLEHRSDNLEIRSPCSGIVVTGDWKRSVGVPLKIGETLFEIAPLDRMIVEIAIPEEDITHVTIGQTVTIRLEAYAGDSWTGELLRVHPASEVKDGEHVFIGEVEIDNPDLRLRPGMRGHAKVTTDRHPILWNVFHKPWNAMIAWLRYSI